MDTDEDDLRDLKKVCCVLFLKAEPLVKIWETLSSFREQHSEQLRNTVKWQLNSRLMDQALQGIILLQTKSYQGQSKYQKYYT